MPFRFNAITGRLDLVNGYVPPPIDFTITSFTNDIGVVEKGDIVDDATFNWIFNKTETDQTISPPLEHPAIGVRTKIYSSLGLTTESTWTLWGTDGSTTDTAYSTIHFHDKRYWTTDVNNDEPSDAEIIAMTQEFGTTRQTTKIFDCSGGKYIWICYPASWGEGTFWVSGLEVSFVNFTKDFINAHGYSTSYYCYRSLYIQNNSAISVEVK
jgi:hypothetical protein